MCGGGGGSKNTAPIEPNSQQARETEARRRSLPNMFYRDVPPNAKGTASWWTEGWSDQAAYDAAKKTADATPNTTLGG